MAHICPVWFGSVLASPVRKLWHNPRTILAGLVEAGMTALDIGCGKGFFSLPMAEMAGPAGRVVCLDCQAGMLDGMRSRAASSGLAARLDLRLCPAVGLGIDDLAGAVDFALAFAVVHEMPDRERLFTDLRAALKPGGRALVAEPAGHVDAADFARTLAAAARVGLTFVDGPPVVSCRTALLGKPGQGGFDRLFAPI